MSEHPTVRELRLVVTTDDYDAAVTFYRDVLGMPVSAEYLSEEQGRVVILDAGAATLEIGDVPHGEYVDEVEVGRRVVVVGGDHEPQLADRRVLAHRRTSRLLGRPSKVCTSEWRPSTRAGIPGRAVDADPA